MFVLVKHTCVLWVPASPSSSLGDTGKTGFTS